MIEIVKRERGEREREGEGKGKQEKAFINARRKQKAKRHNVICMVILSEMGQNENGERIVRRWKKGGRKKERKSEGTSGVLSTIIILLLPIMGIMMESRADI